MNTIVRFILLLVLSVSLVLSGCQAPSKTKTKANTNYYDSIGSSHGYSNSH